MGRVKKNGCLAWPGLAEAGLNGGNKTDPPETGTRFFPLLGILFSVPGEKQWNHMVRTSIFTLEGKHYQPEGETSGEGKLRHLETNTPKTATPRNRRQKQQ